MNRHQRKALAWLALPAVIVLAFSAKVIGMYASAHQSISAYWKGDYPAAIDAARGQEFLNWFEPYKAPFNAGTAFAASGAFDQARDRFAEALGLARGLEVCPVRFNLALAIERLGDDALAAHDHRGALAHYAESLAITQGTPAECDSDAASAHSSDPSRSLGEALDAAERRVGEKLGAAQEQEKDAQQKERERQQTPQQGEETPQLGGGSSGGRGDDGDSGEEQGSGADRPPDATGDNTGSGTGAGGGGVDESGSVVPAGLDELRERMEESAREREAILSSGRHGSAGSSGGAERPW